MRRSTSLPSRLGGISWVDTATLSQVSSLDQRESFSYHVQVPKCVVVIRTLAGVKCPGGTPGGWHATRHWLR